jgi:hypothetical protein
MHESLPIWYSCRKNPCLDFNSGIYNNKSLKSARKELNFYRKKVLFAVYSCISLLVAQVKVVYLGVQATQCLYPDVDPELFVRFVFRSEIFTIISS